jgi:hypothetical protein
MTDGLEMSRATAVGSLRIVLSVLHLWMNHGCLTNSLVQNVLDTLNFHE